MHLPPLFEESRPEVLHALVRARPLATLVIATPDGLDAHHLPMILQAEDHGPVSLLGHAARANTLGEAARHEPRALAIFQGPAAYISPSWYPTKRIDGRVVPTWNYVVAHAHGRLRLHDDPDWVLRQADLLTRQQEHSREHPWSVHDAPADYLRNLARAIVGLELVVDRWEGKWKAGQNQPASNRLGAAEGLEATGDAASTDMARVMRERGA